MIVTGAFAGPIVGESPMGTENLVSSAKAVQVMTKHTRTRNIFFMDRFSFPKEASIRVVWHRSESGKEKTHLQPEKLQMGFMFPTRIAPLFISTRTVNLKHRP